MRLWHQCLGHLHLKAIHTMLQKKLVNGLSISLLKEYDHACEGCILGKSHRLLISKVNNTAYEKMELVVVDITGPMSVKT